LGAMSRRDDVFPTLGFNGRAGRRTPPREAEGEPCNAEIDTVIPQPHTCSLFASPGGPEGGPYTRPTHRRPLLRIRQRSCASALARAGALSQPEWRLLVSSCSPVEGLKFP